MMAVTTAAYLAANPCISPSVKAAKTRSEHKTYCKLQSYQQVTVTSRREALVSGAISILSLNWISTPMAARAEEEEDKDEGAIGVIKSFLDPNEKTKSGRLLPKAYLKTAREVVKTLRESVQEDPNDNAKFRRTADSAKESIREYLSNWRGKDKVVSEESYVLLEKAIRSLASFYSRAGPSAPLPESVKSEILDDLQTAEEYL
ncbi:Photosystem II D1 precursor processing protein PSB27-H2, chloroplastic [Linum grandiflorum]